MACSIEIMRRVTAVMREADLKFEDSGGSTRHYVRDLLLPLLEKDGLVVVEKKRIATLEALLREVSH